MIDMEIRGKLYSPTNHSIVGYTIIECEQHENTITKLKLTDNLNKSRYKTALEVYQEYSDDDNPIKWTFDFENWCKSKDKNLNKNENT